MKNYYFTITPLYFLSISFSLSSSSWMSIWIGMEMNLLTFIFLILNSKTFNSNESCMKYFLIQSVGSLMFLFCISMQMLFYNESFFINALVPPLALMLKSGIAPLHFWTPDLSMKFSPSNLFLFITMQKIVPLLILFSSWSTMIKWAIPLNIMIGALGGMCQSSINKTIIFSSMNNSGWMLLSLTESFLLFFLFFFTYFLMNFMLMKFIKNHKIKWITQIKSHNFFKKIMFMSLMLSLSGLPPFLGFIPKWIILKKIIFMLPMFAFLSILFSVFIIFFYLKLSIFMFFYSSLTKKWINWFSYSSVNISLNILINFTSSFFFILCM
uniref:NADH-ubiquinone oxidoreductase chain 2 n=1 Tax=Arytainilla spartiophila TaxID=178948 RepID=A0A344A253_ARYSP|nr:NADH dehydrogenase subunit 2 [Arytainilla spartiophila]AWU48844.1 NADH dehydrogenase subunit 2 [Arytainilla spartiophila]